MLGRYADDIIRTTCAQVVEDILKQTNTLQPALEFTVDLKNDFSIPFLDMLVTGTSAGILRRPGIRNQRIQIYWCPFVPVHLHATKLALYRVLSTDWTTSPLSGAAFMMHWRRRKWRGRKTRISIVSTIQSSMIPLPNCIGAPEDTVAPKERKKKRERAALIMQCRGSIFDRFARSVRGVVSSNIVFTTRKLRTALPSLNKPIQNELSNRVVCEIWCPECQSSFVGQKSRLLNKKNIRNLTVQLV